MDALEPVMEPVIIFAYQHVIRLVLEDVSQDAVVALDVRDVLVVAKDVILVEAVVLRHALGHAQDALRPVLPPVAGVGLIVVEHVLEHLNQKTMLSLVVPPKR
jgi:hypothetical protein